MERPHAPLLGVPQPPPSSSIARSREPSIRSATGSGNQRKSSSQSKLDLDEEEEEKLPGFVIEFRLSKAYQSLVRQDKAVSRCIWKYTYDTIIIWKWKN